MPELSEEEREEFARLREEYGDVEVEPPTGIDAEAGPIDPMLAETVADPLDAIDEAAWYAEPKYDGTRLIVETVGGELRAYTRRHTDRIDDIPEVADDLAALPEDLVLDGELTFVTPTGASEFLPIHTGREELNRRDLTTVLYVFDLLWDGEDRTDRPLSERKERLADLVTDGDHLQLTPVREDDFPGFYRELTDRGEEGIILKRRESRYYPGVRSEQWLKVKKFTERDAVVVGYTEGEGERADTFGSLVLTDGERCIGRVGSGFTEDDLADLSESMVETDEKPVSDEEAGAEYTPVELFVVRVRYQEVTSEGKLRAPVFAGQNPEKPIEDVQPVG